MFDVDHEHTVIEEKQSLHSYSNAKVSPSKQTDFESNRLVKIQEKILQTQSDIMDDESEVSFSDTYRSSMIPGEMYVSVTTFSNEDSDNK
jgi:hypothetical protein